MKVVGVVGAGVMGRGVAQTLAQAGFEVCLVDLAQDILDAARSDIRGQLRLQRLLKRDAPVDSSGGGVDGVLERIRCTTRLEDLDVADYVIENVVERWSVKQEVYRDLDRHCRRDCLFAANTSAIPITRIAAATTRAAQVIGIHFMNPVPMKRSVEVIRAVHTSDATIEATKVLLARMGKEAIVVNDSPGFVSNRVLMITINEAFEVWRDRVCDARDVDRIFRDCFGHAMGPLETADLIGLDTILFSIEVLREEFGSAKYTPSPLLRRLVDAGHLGRKTGRGVFDYPQA